VKRDTTIRNVKERIRSSTGVRRDNIRLCFLGTVLGVTGDEANSDEEQAKVYYFIGLINPQFCSSLHLPSSQQEAKTLADFGVYDGSSLIWNLAVKERPSKGRPLPPNPLILVLPSTVCRAVEVVGVDPNATVSAVYATITTFPRNSVSEWLLSSSGAPLQRSVAVLPGGPGRGVAG
jgi:hypothetical protein